MRLTSNSARDFLASGKETILVSVIATAGSTPRDEDTHMLVTEDALCGTIGGGVLEHMAVQRARDALNQAADLGNMDIKLGPEIGQCCGGAVSLYLEKADQEVTTNLLAALEEETQQHRSVYIFGAGHVGEALATCMEALPYKVVIVDTRESILSNLSTNSEKLHTAIPESVVMDAPASSAFIVLTHDHALDFLITKTALEKGDAAYVGLIGSRTKRKKFESWFRHEGGKIAAVQDLVCPIGSNGAGDKRPEIIAALVTAEVITHLSSKPALTASPKIKSVEI